ncbi:MAG: hypothetical protein J6Q98_01130, partial [Bacteroidaceae bacterium]|nr:hypothetical protein [Bacteroidaceae bacterium]
LFKEAPLSVKCTAIGHAKHRVSGAAWVAKKCALPKVPIFKEAPLSVKCTAIGHAKQRVSGAAWVAKKCALPKVPILKKHRFRKHAQLLVNSGCCDNKTALE